MIKPIKFESEIMEVKILTPTVKSFILSIPTGFRFEPGQYVNIIMTMPDGHIERRSYSISNSDDTMIEICVDKVENGRVSPLLHEMKRGQKLQVQGPLGVFVMRPGSNDKDIVFIATGTGITPFVAMIPSVLAQTKKKIILIDGYRYENEVLYKEVFDQLRREYKNFEHHTTISRPSENHSGEKGRVQQLIEKYVPSTFSGDFYLCGLFEMIKDVGEMLARKNVRSEHIIFERYD